MLAIWWEYVQYPETWSLYPCGLCVWQGLVLITCKHLQYSGSRDIGGSPLRMRFPGGGKIQSKWCNIDCYKFKVFDFINATWHGLGIGDQVLVMVLVMVIQGWKVSKKAEQFQCSWNLFILSGKFPDYLSTLQNYLNSLESLKKREISCRNDIHAYFATWRGFVFCAYE